jgi:hypothetical protein
LHISEFGVRLAKIEIITAVLLKVLGLLAPEDEDTIALRIVGISNGNGLAIKKFCSSDSLLIRKFVPA